MVGFRTRKDGRVFPTSKPNKVAVTPVVNKNRAGLSPVQLEMAKQIGARELKFAKFTLLKEGENKLTAKKGTKFIGIEYDRGADLYNVTTGRIKNGFDIERDPTDRGVFAEDLRPRIQAHFPRFEYVMDQFVRSR